MPFSTSGYNYFFFEKFQKIVIQSVPRVKWAEKYSVVPIATFCFSYIWLKFSSQGLTRGYKWVTGGVPCIQYYDVKESASCLFPLVSFMMQLSMNLSSPSLKMLILSAATSCQGSMLCGEFCFVLTMSEAVSVLWQPPALLHGELQCWLTCSQSFTFILFMQPAPPIQLFCSSMRLHFWSIVLSLPTLIITVSLSSFQVEGCHHACYLVFPWHPEF